jgi:hypothetical protein
MEMRELMKLWLDFQLTRGIKCHPQQIEEEILEDERQEEQDPTAMKAPIQQGKIVTRRKSQQALEEGEIQEEKSTKKVGRKSHKEKREETTNINKAMGIQQTIEGVFVGKRSMDHEAPTPLDPSIGAPPSIV